MTRVIPFVGGEPREEKNEPDAEVFSPEAIGTIRFIYDSFVLIYTPTNAKVAAGSEVMVLDRDGRTETARLRMSAERKGDFLVADRISGQPSSGQLVVTTEGRSARVSDYQVLE